MAKKKQADWRVTGIAIICLTGLEICAMAYGINGTMRTIIFSMIALLAGLSLPQLKI